MRTIDLLAELIGDTAFPDIEAFALDHQTLLRRLEGLTVDDLSITQLSATQVEAQAQGFTLVLSGGQLAKVSSAQELATAIDTAFSDGRFSLMDLSFEGQPVLSFSLTETGYVFRSGQQSLHFFATWPETLSDLFSRFSALALNDRDTGSAGSTRALLEHIQTQADWTGFSLSDGAQELVTLTTTQNEVALSAGGLALSVQQARKGDALHLTLQINGNDSSTASLSKISSTNLAELKGRVPEVAEALEITLSPQDTDRIEALVDHTYISYRLDQDALGPFSFELMARIDHFYSDTVLPAVTGTTGDDLLVGTATDDLFLGLAGDDVIAGGPGTDAARYFGLSSAFHVEIGRDSVTVRDRRPDGDGTDSLTQIDHLRFDDLSLAVAPLEMTQAQGAQAFRALTELYIAYFDRAPDALGLLFWTRAHIDGMPLAEISEHFFAQPEAEFLRQLDDDPDLLVAEVYQHVLGRDPDDPGLAFWSDALASGDISAEAYILQFLQGAYQPSGAAQDAARIQALGDIGLHYAAVRGLGHAPDAEEVLDFWEGTDASKHAALFHIDALWQDAEAAGDVFTIGYGDLAALEPDLMA